MKAVIFKEKVKLKTIDYSFQLRTDEIKTCRTRCNFHRSNVDFF